MAGADSALNVAGADLALGCSATEEDGDFYHQELEDEIVLGLHFLAGALEPSQSTVFTSCMLSTHNCLPLSQFKTSRSISVLILPLSVCNSRQDKDFTYSFSILSQCVLTRTCSNPWLRMTPLRSMSHSLGHRLCLVCVSAWMTMFTKDVSVRKRPVGCSSQKGFLLQVSACTRPDSAVSIWRRFTGHVPYGRHKGDDRASSSAQCDFWLVWRLYCGM